MPSSLLFFIPVAMSVGWTQWRSYPWQCLLDGHSNIHTRDNVCRMDTVAFQWHSKLDHWKGKLQKTNTSFSMAIIGNTSLHSDYGLFLPLPTCCPSTPSTLSRMCILSVKSSYFVSAFPLFWLSPMKTPSCAWDWGVFIFVCPQQIKMKWFTEALKIIGYQIVYFFLYCKRAIFIWYFIFLFHVAGTLEKKNKSTTYPVIILGI